MNIKFPAFVGFRYIRAKRRTRFVSFISFVSMLGMALGVAALITVLSVMNGFNAAITQQLFAVAPAITVTSGNPAPDQWPPALRSVAATPGVLAVAPFVSGKGMLIHNGQVMGVEVIGVRPHLEPTVSAINKKIVMGDYQRLQPDQFGLVIGAKLAERLGVSVNDRVNLFVPETNATPFGLIPRYRQCTVVGIFNTQSGFGFDTSVAYMHFNDAAKLFNGASGVQGLHIKLQNIYQAPRIRQQLQRQLSSPYYVSDWTQSFGAFFKALAMQKVMMFFILMLIVAVAGFNLVATLMMTVNDKRTDIAILRTLGASRRTIIAIFMIQGAGIGCIGVVVGVIAGIALALNTTAIVNAVQHLFHVQFLSKSVFLIDYLPSQLRASDVILVSMIALLVSVLATVYPARTAAKILPAKALRYD